MFSPRQLVDNRLGPTEARQRALGFVDEPPFCDGAPEAELRMLEPI